MWAPAFWWRPAGPTALLMAPLAAVVGAVAARRLRRTGQAAGVPVICVGNLTVGGAGKTPTALHVASLLMAVGERPAFLTRGYGGRLRGPLRVDPVRHHARDVGDEPLLLARVATTVVSADRIAGSAAAIAAGASVIVMDDGFQNPSLIKDLAILVVDGRRGVGNGRIVPAGPLRAPLQQQLARAHAIVAVGEIAGAAVVIAAARQRGIPVFAAALEPGSDAIAAVGGRPVLAFTGIADPEKFFRTVAAAGIDAPVRRSFADHHQFTGAEAADLIADADRHGLLPLTTEKDAVRLIGQTELAALAARTLAVPVRLKLADPDAFARFIRAAARPDQPTT